MKRKFAMTNVRLIILLIAAAAVLAGCASPPVRPQSVSRGDYDGIKTYVSQLIRHEMDNNAVTGLSIALVDDQRIVWAEGFGQADKEHGQAASAQTIYRVGSISKLFTATAAMQLAEQKKLDIDRPLQQYLPGFFIKSRYSSAAPITPRNLMSHHSGLPRDFAKGMWNRNPAPFTELTRQLKSSDTAYPPDLLFSYSNIGVSLLGHVIRNVSGIEFADYMQHAVLEPIGMDSATFETGPARSPLMARGYRKGELADELPLRDVPAGGLNASVIDLGHFLAMIFADGRAADGQVLRPESVAEMLRPQNAEVPLDLNFHTGLGWMLSTLGSSTIENAGPVAHHAGATLLFRSQMYTLPEHKLGVVVLANSSSAAQVVDHVATETLALALEAKTGIQQPQRTEQAAVPAEPWPVAKLQPYVGDYTTAFGHIQIRLEGERLRADAMGRSFNLVGRSDDRLGVEYALLGLLKINLGNLSQIGFSRHMVAGRDLLVATLGQQEMLIGQRIHPPANLGRWRQRAARYEIANLDGDHAFADSIRITEERGFMLVELAMTDTPGQVLRMPLMPISDNEAILLESLADSGETLRCDPGADSEQCTFAGYTLRKLAD